MRAIGSRRLYANFAVFFLGSHYRVVCVLRAPSQSLKLDTPVIASPSLHCPFSGLLRMLQVPQSLGFLGGRPNHATFWIGAQGEGVEQNDEHLSR